MDVTQGLTVQDQMGVLINAPQHRVPVSVAAVEEVKIGVNVIIRQSDIKFNFNEC